MILRYGSHLLFFQLQLLISRWTLQNWILPDSFILSVFVIPFSFIAHFRRSTDLLTFTPYLDFHSVSSNIALTYRVIFVSLRFSLYKRIKKKLALVTPRILPMVTRKNFRLKMCATSEITCGYIFFHLKLFKAQKNNR